MKVITFQNTYYCSEIVNDILKDTELTRVRVKTRMAVHILYLCRHIKHIAYILVCIYNFSLVLFLRCHSTAWVHILVIQHLQASQHVCVWVLSYIRLLQLLGLVQVARLLCPWNSPGENSEAGCRFLIQGIFLTQGSYLCLLCLPLWKEDSLSLSHLGSLSPLVQLA